MEESQVELQEFGDALVEAVTPLIVRWRQKEGRLTDGDIVQVHQILNVAIHKARYEIHQRDQARFGRASEG